MSVGTSVAVINYISRIFTPIESLGMEIQTIQLGDGGRQADRRVSCRRPERAIPEERRD